MPKKAKLLIIDTDIRCYNYLTFKKKYDCIFITSPQQALISLRKHSFDVVICEYILPEINGLNLIEKIRKNYVSIPIIFISNVGTFSTAVKALNFGASSLLAKPFCIEDLIYNIDLLLQARKQEKSINSNTVLSKHNIDSYIKAHLLDRNIKNKILSNFNLSESTLYRYLKNYFNMPLTEIITEKKLLLAKKWLKNKNLSIKDISDKLYFNNEYYFSNWFKKNTNLCPSYYRELKKNSINKIKIGVLVDLSGYYAYGGYELLRGVNFCIEQDSEHINKNIEMIPIDTSADPKIAESKIQIAEKHGIHAFIGTNRSDITLTTAQQIDPTKSIFVTGSPINFHNFNYSNILQWSTSPKNFIPKLLFPFINKNISNKKWLTITADYIFGHIILDELNCYIKKYNKIDLKNIFHPIGFLDFSKIFKQALDNRIDTIILINYGFDTIQALYDALTLNINKKIKIIIPWVNGNSLLKQFRGYNLENVYFGCQYWHNFDIKANNNFVSNWKNKYLEEPSYENVLGYQLLNILTIGIKEYYNSKNDYLLQTLKNIKWPGFTKEEEYFLFNNQLTEKGYFLLEANNM